MPYGDGTGPQGQGPITGRGLGPCNKGNGRKMGGAFGFGRRGLMNRFNRGNKAETKEELAAYRKSLEQELEKVKAAEGSIDVGN